MGLVWICNVKISGDLYLLALFASLVCSHFLLSCIYFATLHWEPGIFPLFSFLSQGGRDVYFWSAGSLGFFLLGGLTWWIVG